MDRRIDELIRAAGVVGAGGAGFPTHVKAAGKAEIVIANGAECEPLIHSDQWLLEHHADEIVGGLRLMMSSSGAARGVVATKEVYHEAIAAMKTALQGLSDLELKLLGNFYPSGDEFILVRECTGRIIPEGGIPLKVGCISSNVETLYNVFQACRGIPVTSRTVTVAGEVGAPGVYRLPIGTPIAEVERLAGGRTVDAITVVDGGPMMGRPLPTAENGVVRKTTSALLFLPSQHPYLLRRTMPQNLELLRTIAICCQCVACTELCPRYQLGHRLEPHKVMRAIINRREEPIEELTQAYLCCECGVCEVVACPLGLSPRNVFAGLKKELAAKKVKPTHHEVPTRVREAYSYTKIPKNRVLERTGLSRYQVEMPFRGEVKSVGRVELPLKQHVGVPATPVVKVGDTVERGDILAVIPEDALGAALHASISGWVKMVDRDRIVLEERA
ncbi:MAG: hypothetical protein A2284_18745 [Deltaproteobacteria bacterium RIFOXYA12_FULL_61_11]|nr:MAG: hypothetical protein A2284_18745 [Deltaproteobacteria bacterium RIFOXYA12_FULL_61_11]